MELMVAMAIFAVLGVALIALLRQSTAFLERGQSGSEVQDVLDDIDRQFAADFANVYVRSASPEGMPDVRMLADRIPFDTDGDGTHDTWTARLAFVRSVTGEASDPVLRRAGTRAGATASLDGEDDLKEAHDGDLRPAGGKEEVCWFLDPWRVGRDGGPPSGAAPGAPPEEVGVLTLYRGVRSPVGGGVASLLPQETLEGRRNAQSRVGILSRDEARLRLRPVLQGVLHLSYGFWTRHVRPEALRPAPNGRLPDEEAPNVGGGGLSLFWDSTRGLLPKGNGPDQFFLARGAASLADPVDDVFPTRVRVTLVVDRVGKDAATGELTRAIGPDDTTIPVDRTSFAPATDPAGKFIKVGREWIQWSDRDSSGFHVEKRGARGTRREAHDAGEIVRAGATLVRDYPVPAAREDLND